MYPRSSHEMITCTFSTTPFQFAKAMAPYIPRALPLLPEIERHAHVEEFISSSGADIYYGGSHACYVPSLDEVHLPPLGAFQSAEAYYSVVLHELTHWTGHESRCGCDLLNRFGSEAYAVDENGRAHV